MTNNETQSSSKGNPKPLGRNISVATALRACVLSAFCGQSDTPESTYASIPSLSEVSKTHWDETVESLESDGCLSPIGNGKLTINRKGVKELLEYYSMRSWIAWSLMLVPWLIEHHVVGLDASSDPIGPVLSAFGAVKSDRSTIDRLLESYGYKVRTDEDTLVHAFDGWVEVDRFGVYRTTPLGAASLGFRVSDKDKMTFATGW